MSVVFFTYAYPPLKYPRSIQISRLVKYSRLDIRVFSCMDGSPTDQSLYGNDGNRALEQVVFEKKIWCDKRRFSMLMDGSYFFERLQLPDGLRPWAMKTARKILKRRLLARNDVLVTFGQPMSDHLAGLILKRTIGMPWIAHFSDPWADSPYLYQHPMSRFANRYMERQVVEKADQVIFTSKETLDLVMKKYPATWRDKASVIPHSYDPELYFSSKTDHTGIVIRYIGGFYKPRTPDSLIHALLELHVNRPELLADLRIELVGPIAKDVEISKDYNRLPKGLLEMCPSVDYKTSLELMTNSDILLVIDAPFDESVFLPSKLVDYVGAGKPILAISPKGATAELVTRLGGWVANPSDVDDIAEKLAMAISMVRDSGREMAWGEAAVRSEYSAAFVAKQFDVIVGKLILSKQ